MVMKSSKLSKCLSGVLLAGAVFSSGMMAVQGQVFVVVDDATNTVNPGETIAVPVKVGAGFADVTSLQFSLGWDPAVLSFDSVGNFGIGANLGHFNQNSGVTDLGKLGFAWDPVSGIGETYPEGTTIFDLSLTAVGAGGTSSMINFTGDPTSQEASINFGATTVSGDAGTISVVPEPQETAAIVLASLVAFVVLVRRQRLVSESAV